MKLVNSSCLHSSCEKLIKFLSLGATGPHGDNGEKGLPGQPGLRV